MIINFAQCNSLKKINTLYKKQTNRRWTWVSPNGETKNEIDYILSNKPSLFTNASVINQFNTENGHRLLRAKLTINVKLVRGNKRPNLQTLSAHEQEFKIQLQNKFKSLNLNDPVDTLEAKITDSINTAAVKDAEKNKKEKIDKLLLVKKVLLYKRKTHKRLGIAILKVEHAELSKFTRQAEQNGIDIFNEKQLLHIIGKRKNIKDAIKD